MEKDYSWCTSTRRALLDDGVRYSKGVGIETELTMGADAGICENHACCSWGALVQRCSGDVMELEIGLEECRLGIEVLDLAIIILR